MARSGGKGTEARIARLFETGAGAGRGRDYTPFLTVRSTSSKGRSSRPFGKTTHRVHHLLSDIERHAFQVYDWAENVIDIREQFPLDRAATQRIAEAFGFRHPTYPGGTIPCVMTTDFLLDVKRGDKTVRVARAVTPSDKLGDLRTLQELPVEARHGPGPCDGEGISPCS